MRLNEQKDRAGATACYIPPQVASDIIVQEEMLCSSVCGSTDDFADRETVDDWFNE